MIGWLLTVYLTSGLAMGIAADAHDDADRRMPLRVLSVLVFAVVWAPWLTVDAIVRAVRR